MQIPAGALTADTVVTVQQTSSQAPNGAVTPVYEFGPSGTTFSQPVTVTIPVPAGTTEGAIWTKQEGATTFTSVPTTISGGTATAQVTHFSVFLVGPVDLSGTWNGNVDFVRTNPDASTLTGSTMQGRDVTQSVGDVQIAITNGNGTSATCAGSVSGSTLTTSCVVRNFEDTCSATYEQTGTVTGSTWINASSYTWTGASCPMNGAKIAVQNSPLTRQAGSPMNVAGTFARVTSWTNGGPTVQSVSGTSTGTVIRTQVAGSSAVHATVSTSGGATHTCLAVVIADKLYSYCRGTNGATVITSNGVGTVSAGSAITVHSTVQSTLQNAGAYTWQTSTSDDTFGCISVAGNWLITAHCETAYVGKTVPITQSACAATATDPVNSAVATFQVTENAVAVSSQNGSCSGSVTGSTLSLTCGTCAQTLVRQ